MYDFDNVFSILTNDQMTAKVDCKIQDTMLQDLLQEKNNNFLRSIRKPQWKIRTFASSKERRKKNAKGRQELFSGAPEFSPCTASKKWKKLVFDLII